MNSWTRRSTAILAFLALLFAAGVPAAAQDKVTFGTNWRAQAEHGGFYQAVAKGIYAKHGLEVTIRQGGPNINHSQLLAAGRIDFNMGGNLNNIFNYAESKIPVMAIAAVMQKDPQVLITHPGQGNDTLQQLKGKPIMLGRGGQLTFFQWMKAEFGYTDDQVRPYTFNVAPFLVDKQAIQQGYITSEPYAIEKEGGMKPHTILLTDFGYDTYATLIETTTKLVQEKPDLVQRFVNASILGWVSYMNEDPTAANELIKKDNPDMTDDKMAFSREAMRRFGIIDSGEAKVGGVGAMSDARIKSFFDKMVKAGVYKADLPYKETYTLQFVNKKLGM
jgi:NitT/TauT family transport system substrate-binding protein